MLKSRRGSVYFNPDYMVQVIRTGLLTGFIPVNTAFGGYSPTHYMGALEASGAVTPPLTGKIIDVKNATVARIQEFAHSTLASVTFTEKTMRFNTDCINFFPDAAFVELLFHPAERILAVRPSTKENKNAVLWNVKPVTAGSLCKNIYTFCGWDRKISYKVMADCFTRNNEMVLMFDLGSAEFYLKEALEKLTINENGEQVSVWKEVSKLFQPEKWQEDFGRDVISHATTCRRWLARSLDEWKVDAPAENVTGFDNYDAILSEKEINCQTDDDMSLTFGTYLESSNPTETQNQNISTVMEND
jgi:hypothetical protein